MLLHVSNGHCATRLIEQSGVPGRTMVWCDPLHDGPVPGDVSDEALLEIRAKTLSPSPNDVPAVIADLKSWRAAVADQDHYDELVLWFEHDLFDQLNLIQLLAHLGTLGAMRKPVTLVCIDAYPGHPDFKGLGELTPADIEALFPSRLPVTADQIALATRAWAAFRSSDPHRLVTLLQTDTSALPLLAAALRRHLEEFPSERDGLSRTERRLMEQVIDGPMEMADAFAGMYAGERTFYVTDSMFGDLVTALAGSNPPLLETTTREFRRSGIHDGTMAVSDAGHAVLEGREDRVRLCGIYRWLGGVELAGHGPVWRWSAKAGTIVLQ